MRHAEEGAKVAWLLQKHVREGEGGGGSLVPRPLFPQLRMDYITATWKEGLARRSNFLVLTCFECYANYCVVISVVIV